MKILVDECCPSFVVTALRSDEHDVEYVAEDAPSTPDRNVLSRALADERIIVTEDRDFCELVFLHKLTTYGIILVRINQTQVNIQDKISEGETQNDFSLKLLILNVNYRDKKKFNGFAPCLPITV